MSTSVSAEEAFWMLRFAEWSAALAEGKCDAANAIVLPGVCQFIRVEDSEQCLRCAKHVSRHYGGTQYRCYSLESDEQAIEVFGVEVAALRKVAEDARKVSVTSKDGETTVAGLFELGFSLRRLDAVRTKRGG